MLDSSTDPISDNGIHLTSLDSKIPDAVLSFSQVLRTYLLTSFSSSPALLSGTTKLLRRMLKSDSFLLSVERNPVLRTLLFETFYRQYCGGSNHDEVSELCSRFKHEGYAGMILEYAREVLSEGIGDEVHDVEAWRQGVLDTIAASNEGGFVGIKWSGMGPDALRRLRDAESPSRRMDEAMHTVCTAAERKGVSLLPSAEETRTLKGFHRWCLAMQRAYNHKGRSVIYNAYQAYLKQTPGILARHLELARQEDFTLGVKVVRGAYLSTEPRDLIWPTIESTHHAYNSIAEALIHRRWNDMVSGNSAWPLINVLLATHNANSVHKAQALRQAQALRGEELTPLAFGQLQGMADEVFCHVLQQNAREESLVKEKVYKLTVWGSLHESLNYLLRRASENMDAAVRTADSRKAMGKEILRRCKELL
ncbi:FAD-linked oxidoreductase [Piedraia hortae CBS 480.64]|uniref:Proline dehydrogenase n=1 Tax=Piedraia hortae CBS 480.64 TaxID=1314780 RepID=A0A6A7BUV1_9PEZI|nr:FAD-linked oxidoreductase [Piedraia hortae CBS 480.64]